MDFKAICTALAARYAPGTISTPTGAQAMRKAYGQAPHGLQFTPAVVVMPQDGTVIVDPGVLRGQPHRIDVNFYLSKSPGDIARVETQRQLWLPNLLSATFGQSKLGLASVVMKAIPVSYEFTELPYGGEMYDGIVIHVEVYTSETITLVAS